MRASIPLVDTSIISVQLRTAPGMDLVRSLKPAFAVADEATFDAVLTEASRFASGYLDPLNIVADSVGCSIHDGQVVTSPEHRAAYSAFVSGGWNGLDLAQDIGGQELPAALAFAVQTIMDRSCPAFGMLPVPQRSAARLLAAFAPPDLQATWLPRLASGDWAATICISEADAGSDVQRIRTKASRRRDGGWTITGSKCWISFGSHDLTDFIGHCVLARTEGNDGLSLFLVPAGREGDPNGVNIRRIAEKLGLHGSPTCEIDFEASNGQLIGMEGRGLQQMFVMITNMRLATCAQGVGIASSAHDIACRYASERVQGGTPSSPLAIVEHADVQRMLLEQMSRIAVLRGLLFAAANYSDISNYCDDGEVKDEARLLLQWLLPIVKTTGGEFAVETADLGMQILGGAGYTRDWPIEQAFRDARALTIFEGTTGIQALDLVSRRVLRKFSVSPMTLLESLTSMPGEP